MNEPVPILEVAWLDRRFDALTKSLIALARAASDGVVGGEAVLSAKAQAFVDAGEAAWVDNEVAQ